MTLLRAHHVGAQPRTASSTPEPHTMFLGPDLPGAACKGCTPLFDAWVVGEKPEERDERHHAAIRICWSCPELATCLKERLTNPGLQRDAGVYGGRVFDATAGRKCPCGKPLPDDASARRKYCNKNCWNTTRPRSPQRELRCDHCESPFTTNQVKQRFCNRGCRDRYRGNRATRPHLPGLTNCQMCGEPIPPGQTAVGRRNCSTNCRKRAAERRQQVAA
jgi:hypothetical protein